MTTTTIQQQKLAHVLSRPHMQEMMILEPELQTILAIASDPEPRENRWISYSALKRMINPLVGWDARQSELRSSRHYELMIQAIDELLPMSEVQEWI